ncbi:hypothetical protein CHS0354_018538 [Potamilus streckersoni]|uniref:Uncharacterized protein n=1 Tax=Potamilus streckersoni TaxID=2493646 RepID=A0AAE0TAK8_9BIVA|nr:hypothetical protein CHS0354_018538 [Potamilus streckersoni]
MKPLEYKADIDSPKAGQAVLCHIINILSVNNHTARCRLVQSCGECQECGFPAPGTAGYGYVNLLTYFGVN